MTSRIGTTVAAAPEIAEAAPIEAFVTREPVTVILSERGWIRAAKGRIDDPSEIKFKEGDKLGFLIPAETTDKLLIFATNGRFYTLGVQYTSDWGEIMAAAILIVAPAVGFFLLMQRRFIQGMAAGSVKG